MSPTHTSPHESLDLISLMGLSSKDHWKESAPMKYESNPYIRGLASPLTLILKAILMTKVS